MEKNIIKLLIVLFYFISNPILSQTVYVVDNNKEPIYNVSFYKKDLSKGIFSNFNGEVDLSIFENRDSIIIQHPTFDSTIKIKSEIVCPILLQLSNTIFQYPSNRKRKRDDFILTRKRKFSEI